MNNEKDKIVLQKMIERIQRTMQYCNGKFYVDFENDLMLQEDFPLLLEQLVQLLDTL